MKVKLLINVDCKPNFKRIFKGTVVDVFKEMPHGYIMVSYNKGYFPIPPGSYEKIKDSANE